MAGTAVAVRGSQHGLQPNLYERADLLPDLPLGRPVPDEVHLCKFWLSVHRCMRRHQAGGRRHTDLRLPFVPANAKSICRGKRDLRILPACTCFGFKRLHGALDYQGLCDLDAYANAFYAKSRGIPGAARALGPQACFTTFLRISAAYQLSRSPTGRPRHFFAPRWRAGRIAGQGEGRRLYPRPSPITLLTQAALGRLRMLSAMSSGPIFPASQRQVVFRVQTARCQSASSTARTRSVITPFSVSTRRGWGRHVRRIRSHVERGYFDRRFRRPDDAARARSRDRPVLMSDDRRPRTAVGLPVRFQGGRLSCRRNLSASLREWS